MNNDFFEQVPDPGRSKSDLVKAPGLGGASGSNSLLNLGCEIGAQMKSNLQVKEYNNDYDVFL